MANITGTVAASGTLTANTVQTFVLSEARQSVTVTVAATGTPADVYFTVGTSNTTPTAPTVGGTDCYIVSGVGGASKTIFAGSAPVVVSCISGGTPRVGVEGNVGIFVRET